MHVQGESQGGIATFLSSAAARRKDKGCMLWELKKR
jgi:hypothetical protein